MRLELGDAGPQVVQLAPDGENSWDIEMQSDTSCRGLEQGALSARQSGNEELCGPKVTEVSKHQAASVQLGGSRCQAPVLP